MNPPYCHIQTSVKLMNVMINAKKFAGNIVIQIVGRILAVLIGLIAIGIMTRHLSTDGFGEYTTTITYLQFFGVLVDFGLTLTLVVMLSEKGANEAKVAGNFLTLRLISGALLFSLAPLFVLLFPWSATVKQAVLVGAVAYWLMGGATMLVGVFQRFASMWRSALAELINRSILVVMVACFAFLDMGVVAMVGASVIANAAWLLSTIYLARPLVKIRPRIDWDVWKRAATLSWPIAISIAFNLMYLKGDIIALSFFRPQSDVAIYGVTYRILDVLTALPTMFMGLLLPSLVYAWSHGKIHAFRTQLTRTFDVFMIVLIPIIVGAQVVATPLMVLIAGDQYTASGPVLQLLILAVVGVFLGALYGHTIIAINKQKIMTLGYAAIAILSITGYLIFIPKFGMWGAVYVTIFSELALALITFLVVTFITKAFPNLFIVGKALLASVAMYLFLLYFPSLHVLTDILLGALVYLAVLFAIKGIKTDEIKALLPTKFGGNLES
jgi:O-antigen/teichoic acid export membrane protein